MFYYYDLGQKQDAWYRATPSLVIPRHYRAGGNLLNIPSKHRRYRIGYLAHSAVCEDYRLRGNDEEYAAMTRGLIIQKHHGY
jgi:hypothetical protein